MSLRPRACPPLCVRRRPPTVVARRTSSVPCSRDRGGQRFSDRQADRQAFASIWRVRSLFLISFFYPFPLPRLIFAPGRVFARQIQDEYDRIKNQRVNEAMMFRQISKLKDASKRLVHACGVRTAVVRFVHALLWAFAFFRPGILFCRRLLYIYIYVYRYILPLVYGVVRDANGRVT